MLNIEFNTNETKNRKAKLKEYYDLHFKSCKNGCNHFDDCIKGFGNEASNFEESFNDCIRIGKYYDTFIDTKPLRILVIGLEGINKEGRKFDSKNEKEFRLYSENGKYDYNTNPHIVGTLETLLKIYTPEQEVELTVKDHYNESHDILFDCYALTNAFKCVFKSTDITGNKHGPQNETMYKYCFLHLKEEIEIMQPTIIITQGVWVGNYDTKFAEIFDSCKKITDVDINHKILGLYEVKLNSLTAFLLMSYHPCRRNWHKIALNKILPPQFEYLKSHNIIPKNDTFQDYKRAHEMAEKA